MNSGMAYCFGSSNMAVSHITLYIKFSPLNFASEMGLSESEPKAMVFLAILWNISMEINVICAQKEICTT